MNDLAWEPTEEDRAFLDVYGPWDPLTPRELAALMDGFERPWWLVGGHAIEAFTGVRRFHEDIDLVIFGVDLPALRAQLGRHFHLWSNHGGTFRVIDDKQPEPLDPHSQVWMRENARSPWRVDCILNQSQDGRYQSRRDPSFVADLDDVTWVADDGIRYLRPEHALWFKAKLHRPKDDVDLDVTWPLLDAGQQEWLRRTVRDAYPDHPWNERLAPGTSAGTTG